MITQKIYLKESESEKSLKVLTHLTNLENDNQLELNSALIVNGKNYRVIELVEESNYRRIIVEEIK